MAAGTSNAQSTAWAVQGLVAAGRDPRKLKRTRTPIQYLVSLQAGDGSVRYSRTSTQTPVWVTAQALAALEGKPFPLRPAPRHKAHGTNGSRAAVLVFGLGAIAAIALARRMRSRIDTASGAAGS
jgi:hypothetical protein